MVLLYLPHVDWQVKYVIFMNKHQDILVYFLLIWMWKKLILKVYKKSVAFGWGKKDQRPIVLLQGFIFNALTDVINLLPFNEFQYVLPWINYLLSTVLFFCAGFSGLKKIILEQCIIIKQKENNIPRFWIVHWW